MSIHINFDDPAEMARFLRHAGQNYAAFALRALLRVIDNPIMSESAVEVPVRTGDLRRSGTNQEEGGPPDMTVSPGVVSVAFGYGKDYGYWVHEILTYYHKPPTKAKFLEDPVNRHLDTIGDAVADEVDRLVGVR